MTTILLINFLIQLSISNKIIEYKFYKNFGQIFYDYSNNNRHAVNGVSLSAESNDLKSTDRGVYSDGTSCKITLPPNNISQESFDLPNPFTILFWRKWISDTTLKASSIFSREFGSNRISLERIAKQDNLNLNLTVGCLSYFKKSTSDLDPSNS